MIISSFLKSEFGLRPLKVEVVLVPGVAQIQILGLADQVIKESSKRIISALRHQGYRIPPGKQVLVNLHPSNLRKTSQGLDLAIALGVLLESKQIMEPDFDLDETYCYAQLSLKGELIVPKDLVQLNYETFDKQVLTGLSEEACGFRRLQVSQLSELLEPTIKEPDFDVFDYQQPALDETLRFSPQLARVMEASALGEHHVLLAGPAGTGKTTVVESLAKLLNPPAESLFKEAKKYWMLSGRDLKARPIVQPHHSATPYAVIGGGRPLRFGEISLAHGGALILDELLEFHPSVQNALREPMEKSQIHLTRIGARATFAARCLILATTNLCPCGHFKPGSSNSCRCSSLRLRNYLERLSGPFLDRFSLFHLIQEQSLDLTVPLVEIKERVQRGYHFRQETRNQSVPNQYLEASELREQVDSSIIWDHLPHSKSLRRRNSLLRVARTLADLDQKLKISRHHLEESQKLTAKDIHSLEYCLFEDLSRM